MRSLAYPKNYIRFAGNFRRRSWELKSSKPLLCCRIDGRSTIDQRSSYRPAAGFLTEISSVHAALRYPLRPTRTCPVFRSRRPLIPPARKPPVVGQPRKAITAMRSLLADQRCISPAIHPSRQSSNSLTPIAPRSRAARHRRKPTRRRGTPCPSCGSPTARSPWPSACRHGQRSPSWTPNMQRHRIPSRKS